MKANTKPSGVELATLALEEAEGSPKANTNPSGTELWTLPPLETEVSTVASSNELELLMKARMKPSGLELAIESPELNDDALR